MDRFGQCKHKYTGFGFKQYICKKHCSAESSFLDIFFKKFGFFPFGIPLIIFISFIDGVFYGYGFSYIISVYGFEKFKMFFIYGVPFNALKNISFFISSWFSAYRVIGKFNIKSGRRFLKQDRERSTTEFVIIFVVSTILSLLSCYAELLLYEKFLFLAIK